MLEVTVDFLSIWMNSHKLSVIFLVITLDDYTDVETVAYARTMF